MNIAAITMVYKGYDTLRRWYQHYGELVGYDQLYVVSHGGDPKHREIAKRANVIDIPRTGLQRFDHNRTIALNGLTRFLEVYYDSVLRTDVDELVFFDPDLYGSLSDCLATVTCDVWFSLGFNVYPNAVDGPLSKDLKISEQRDLCVSSASYSKAVVARNGIFIGHHGARDETHRDGQRMGLPRGLYLAHIPYAEHPDAGVMDSTTEISRRSSETANELASVLALPVMDGEKELDEVFELLSQGFGRFRRKRPGIWVVPQIKRETAFRLPARFKGCF
ncbi:hypothetical protein AIOL_004630 [Candidatus Rhodobacter oscarellae]|uniref:Glycosyl transferase family 2 n=1 Tax=Candidatus Rhodobacter oscarellae TaxID=1675527 RepID=A0A0J9H1Q3_9RHOB|nr:glycosyltransferase family 2 protein [Candidatus Rhodobacter lobularis]KMW59648.1 hypothetical protein AIOL_004630 [Candidatus Rhodobacter lobularis]